MSFGKIFLHPIRKDREVRNLIQFLKDENKENRSILILQDELPHEVQKKDILIGYTYNLKL
jgi:hypothetical protein